MCACVGFVTQSEQLHIHCVNDGTISHLSRHSICDATLGSVTGSQGVTLD